ncbi:MAG: Resolvase domain protein, partial [Marmoricola sp.]|nr:Resolvase domain protein [Marmoricola sp.]
MTASPNAEPAKRAVVYLRVSTPRQMNTAVDVDPEGNSIATQREMCLAKATQLDAQVVADFVEPGNSAQSIEKRPEFKKLVQYLENNRDIDYVIVYMRSRAFRNSTDAGITKRALGLLGIRIVSCKEDFGTGPVADAMETVADAFNELQVRQNGEDIRLKLRHKKRNGGTVSRAKLGYLNIRAEHEGKLFNTIGVDERRAPLIRKAFELFATNEFTYNRLEATMADLGLTTRPSARSPRETTVNASRLRDILADPVYAGWVVLDGELIPGRHEALVTQELFDNVQEVMATRAINGSRDRILKHYLKGILFCDRCHQHGRTSRLIYVEARGRNGQRYPYFVCRLRQDRQCDLPHLPAREVEDAVVRHYTTVPLPAGFADAVRARLREVTMDEEQSTREAHQALTANLAKLDVREQRLIDLAADGLIERGKIVERANQIRRDRTRLQAGLATTGAELAVGVERLSEALTFVTDPATTYRDAPNKVRQQVNAALFEGLYLDDEPTAVVLDKWKAPFDEIREAGFAYNRHKDLTLGDRSGRRSQEKQTGGPSRFATDRLNSELPMLADIFSVGVSTNRVVVELRGFEPLTFSLPSTPCATRRGTRKPPRRAALGGAEGIRTP